MTRLEIVETANKYEKRTLFFKEYQPTFPCWYTFFNEGGPIDTTIRHTTFTGTKTVPGCHMER